MKDKINTELAKLETNLNELKKATDYISETNKKSLAITESAIKVVDSINMLQKEYETLKQTNEILLSKIDKVDFPSRLDKIDVVLATTNQNVSSVQSSIVNTQTTISSNQSRTEKVLFDLENSFTAGNDKLTQKVQATSKELSNSIFQVQQTINSQIPNIIFIKKYLLGFSIIALVILSAIIYKLFL